MYRILKLLAATVIVTGCAGEALAEDLTIRWGTEAGYKPFMYKTEDGELAGFDYDMGNAICEELKAKCSWVEQDWDGLIPALQAGKYDAILASMSITEERKRVVDFTAKYYKIPYRFVGHTDGELTPDQLAGKTVGVQSGTVTQVYLERVMPDVIVKTYPTQDQVWLDLAAGRIDAGFANVIVAEDSFLSKEEGKDFDFFGPDYTVSKYFGDGTGIALRKTDTELRDAISDAIAKLRQDGTYAKINARYFPFDVYGK
ncbi:transporter substrate-binding domain-containing protein (plasmid) [Ensifer adhaerens]|uniref:transporter substrate-binding domain-containing protein n=1 Tax=Ensifer adhaerens TaxID=106592 RepID=UPI0023A9387A|nr:transporter substrate-binding domain-containing protein [Ensifer adhaerens]WDZ81937.1 transporter substrate-binding domain-containing protein [Ensifer adhaerens]